jgi:hypothetical protein
MLQLPKGYDVISYRIEHVKTAENPIHYVEIEREIMDNAGYYIPDKYLAKYFYGPRIEPFIRIYRTIAPHSEVEKYLNSGGDLLTLFKEKNIDQIKEEPCYTSLETPWPFTIGPDLGIDFDFFLLDEEEYKKKQKEKESTKREFELTLASKLKNISNKFIAKCLEIDDFFEDVEKYLEDPADFHREQIIQRVIMLEHTFELCESLDPQLPDGFAEKTSSLSKNKIIEILSVVEVLKWQVGVIKEIDDKIWNSDFHTKDILWNSDEFCMLFDNDCTYILKEVATREENRRLVIPTDDEVPISPDSYLSPDYSNLLQVNPHKHNFYYNETRVIRDGDYYFGSLEGKSIKDYITGKAQNNLAVRAYDLLTKGNSYDLIKKGDNFYDKIMKSDLRLFISFIREFLEGVLLKNLERYPSFLRERLVNVNTYPGNMFRLDLISEGKFEEYIEYIHETKFETYGFDAGASTDSRIFFNVESPDSLLFDIAYMADYSDLIILAGQLEKQGLSVYEALNKIQDFDPDDTIANRFLAEFAYNEINKGALSDLWNKFFGKKIYEESEKEEDPAEAMAVKAFKIYRKTLKQLVKMLGLASSVDPTITMFDKQGNLPGLAVIVKEYLLNKLRQYSRIPLNKSFVRDANEEDMDIWGYILLQNEDARIIRNKFSHGVDITEQELIQFVSFCEKIKQVAKETNEILEKKIAKTTKKLGKSREE